MTLPLPVAVIGAGYFGRFHAKHYAANDGARLVAVVDKDLEKARSVAAKFGAEHALADHASLADRVSAVSVVVSTPAHFEVARDMLAAGVHVLVEKPITDSVVSAVALVKQAKEANLILQVGHLERHSAAYKALVKAVTQPLYIESQRLAVWTERAGQVGVVLDMMIHDIDIILGLVNEPVKSVHAVSAPIINSTEDMANALIIFKGGCVANVTASRISEKSERIMRVYQPGGYLVCDFTRSRVDSFMKRGDWEIKHSIRELPPEDSLGNQIAEFLDCVRNGGKPTVDGSDGLAALRIASLINESLKA